MSDAAFRRPLALALEAIKRISPAWLKLQPRDDACPHEVGHFENGGGEFYGTDTLNGKLIYVRFVWTKTNTSTPHFEQSYSEDGGQTWEVNWITDQTRISDGSDKTH